MFRILYSLADGVGLVVGPYRFVFLAYRLRIGPAGHPGGRSEQSDI
jgi:hypothetical protein